LTDNTVLNNLKEFFIAYLKTNHHLDVVKTAIKHKVNNGRSDVIKFIIKDLTISPHNRYVLVYVDRYNKGFIDISTNIDKIFLITMYNDFLSPYLYKEIDVFKKTLQFISDKFILFDSMDYDIGEEYGHIKHATSKEFSEQYFNMSSLLITKLPINTDVYPKWKNCYITSQLQFIYNNDKLVAFPVISLHLGNIYHAQKLKNNSIVAVSSNEEIISIELSLRKNFSSHVSKFVSIFENLLYNDFYKALGQFFNISLEDIKQSTAQDLEAYATVLRIKYT